MNDAFHNKPLQLAKRIPEDRSLVLNTSVKKKLKKKNRIRRSGKAQITEIELNLLKSPRQTISILEPIVETYIKKLYIDALNKKKIDSTFTEAELDESTNEVINALLINGHTGLRAKLIKRERLRFFAKAISSGRVNSIEDCYKVAYECGHVNALNQTRGMVGLILDNLALFYMMLGFSKDTLERFDASFISELLGVISHSLVVAAGVLQIASIITENQPLQLQHYAQIAFISTMTSLGLIGYCTGNSYFGLISAGLSIFRNILILCNEYQEYLKAEPGSDKQISHKQACIGTLNDVLLSALAITLTAVVMFTPFSGSVLTLCIIGLTLMKFAWQFMPMTSKIKLKQSLGFGKQEYEEDTNLPIAQPVGPVQSPASLVMVEPISTYQKQGSDKPLSKSAKRRARRKKLALLSSIVVAEPVDGDIIDDQRLTDVNKEDKKTENMDCDQGLTDNDPEPTI